MPQLTMSRVRPLRAKAALVTLTASPATGWTFVEWRTETTKDKDDDCADRWTDALSRAPVSLFRPNGRPPTRRRVLAPGRSLPQRRGCRYLGSLPISG
jgi:hypothetical protein